MKPVYASATLGFLLAAAGTTAAAASWSLNKFPNHAVPVLVSVDSSGKVTNVSPGTPLPHKLNRLLRQNLDELVTGPATEHGRPIGSQCIINLAIESALRADGNYDVHFTYVSSKPVPSGSWHWVDLDGHQLALASNQSMDMANMGAFHHTTGYSPAPVSNSGGSQQSMPTISAAHVQSSGTSSAPAHAH